LTSPVTTRPNAHTQNSITSDNRSKPDAAKNLEKDFENLISSLNESLPGDVSEELKTEKNTDLHKARIENSTENNTQTPITKENLNFFERFLHDNWGMRTFFSLGNEIAESSKHLLNNLLPEPIAKLIHKILWSLAIVSTGSRVAANSIKAKEGEQLKAGAKMLVHDGVAAITVPTLVANIMNSLQHKIYGALRLPIIIRDLLTTAGSLWACNKTIHFLDPHAAELGARATQLKHDRYKEINDALGKGH